MIIDIKLQKTSLQCKSRNITIFYNIFSLKIIYKIVINFIRKELKETISQWLNKLRLP